MLRYPRHICPNMSADAVAGEGRVTFLVRDDEVPPEPEDFSTPNGNGPG